MREIRIDFITMGSPSRVSMAVSTHWVNSCQKVRGRGEQQGANGDAVVRVLTVQQLGGKARRIAIARASSTSFRPTGLGQSASSSSAIRAARLVGQRSQFVWWCPVGELPSLCCKERAAERQR